MIMAGQGESVVSPLPQQSAGRHEARKRKKRIAFELTIDSFAIVVTFRTQSLDLLNYFLDGLFSWVDEDISWKRELTGCFDRSVSGV